MIAALDLIFLVLTFLFVFAATFAVADILERFLVLRRRLGHATSTGGPAPESSLLRKLNFSNTFLDWVQSSSSISEPKARLKLARDLAHAGFEHPAAPVWYVIIRFSLAIILPFAFILGQRLVATPSQGFGAFFWPLLLCAAGLLLPRVLLDRRIESRRAQLEREFPDALDLMVVCVEAGLGLEAAFVLSAIWRNHLVAREKLKSQRAEQAAVELMNQQKSVDSQR
jgi:tight adherence protein C